jgi:hypothetical protein
VLPSDSIVIFLFVQCSYSALPSFNKEAVDKDIDGVKDLIKKKKEEL